MKKITTVVAAVLMVATSVNAGWFSHKDDKKNKAIPTEKAYGYTEKTEVITNSWSNCIDNWKLRTTLEQYNWNTYTNSFTNCTFDQYNTCTKPHISDYPKTKVEIIGAQNKNTTIIYKDGKVVSVVVEYKYPHKKITKSTTTKIKFVKELETIIEVTTEPNKGE